MGDEQHRPAMSPPHLGKPDLHPAAGQRIERAKGFIEQQHRPLLYHGTQQRRSLAHAAGKCRWIMFLETGKTKFGKQRPHLASCRLPAHALHLQPERGIVDDPPPRHQRIALRHEGEGARALRQRCAIEEDRAALRLQGPRQHPEKRRLAGAGGAENRDEFAGIDSERETVEHGQPVVTAGDAGKLQARRRHGLFPSPVLAQGMARR